MRFVIAARATSVLRHHRCEFVVLGGCGRPEAWRGQVESNATAPYELFDVGARCRRQTESCWVRYIKVRVLSHHEMEDAARVWVHTSLALGSDFGVPSRWWFRDPSLRACASWVVFCLRCRAGPLVSPRETITSTRERVGNEALEFV